MRVGIPRETTQGERRVALVPETVGKLVAAGFELVVEQGSGKAASFPDDAYTDAGAVSGDPWGVDGGGEVSKQSPDGPERLREGPPGTGSTSALPAARPRAATRAS